MRANKDKENTIPVADNGQVVLDTLIVDISAFFKTGHGDFDVANSLCMSSHALGDMPQGTDCLSSLVGDVEHRTQRRSRRGFWLKERSGILQQIYAISHVNSPGNIANQTLAFTLSTHLLRRKVHPALLPR